MSNSVFELARQVIDRPLVVERVGIDLLDGLRATALTLMATTPSAVSLSLRAWKSREGILAHETFAPFVDVLRGVITACRPYGWVMINRSGSEHPRHRHPSARLCGLYFVTAGDPATPTVFETLDGDVAVDPAPGRLVLFSPMMWHRVPRYDGAAPRISIAFDVDE